MLVSGLQKHGLVWGFELKQWICLPSYSTDCHYASRSYVRVTWITQDISLVPSCEPGTWQKETVVFERVCANHFNYLHLHISRSVATFWRTSKKLANTQCPEIQEVCYLSLKQSQCSFACQGTVINLTRKLWQPLPKLVHLSPHFRVTFALQLKLLSCLQKWYFKGVKELLEKATENNTQRLEFINACRGSLTLSDDLLYFAITAKITTNYLKWFPPLPPLLSLFSTNLSKSTLCFVY